MIEACGGLKDGMVTVQRSTADGFMNGLYSQIEEDLAEGAMLAWAQNGEPLSPGRGRTVALRGSRMARLFMDEVSHAN